MLEPLRAIDTSVLLHYLLNDVPAQSDAARRLVDSAIPLAVTAIALAEVAWVLAGPRYRQARDVVATQLVDLLARENIVTVGLDKSEAQASLLACALPVGSANFGNALIAACARSASVDDIYSFDRRFTRTGMNPIPLP